MCHVFVSHVTKTAVEISAAKSFLISVKSLKLPEDVSKNMIL